jgi:hypothetical protein
MSFAEFTEKQKEDGFILLLRELARLNGMNLSSLLQYAFSHFVTNEVSRAEAKGIEIAQQKFGGMFMSTGGASCDLMQVDLQTHQETGIYVEVTSSKTIPLKKKMESSMRSS